MIANRLRAVLVAVLALASLAIVIAFWPLKLVSLSGVVNWLEGLGAWGAVLIAAFYIPASVLLIPGSLVSLSAGYLFGLVWGVAAVWIGSTLGACLAFLVSRYLVRDWVEKKLLFRPAYRAVDAAVAEQGFKVVFLVRLSPVIPFAVTNYLFGASQVSLRSFALASWIGMLPGAILYVYFGTAARNLAELSAGDWAKSGWARFAFFAGLAATIIVTVIIARVANRALKQAGIGSQE